MSNPPMFTFVKHPTYPSTHLPATQVNGNYLVSLT
jgi:hypothetical protein